MKPQNLSKMLTIQIVGGDRQNLRWEPDLSVSVKKLRRAFHWSSGNSWPFMAATKLHALWETGSLDDSLEALLLAYARSVGVSDGGVPSEFIDGASRIAADRATIHAPGPPNCVPSKADPPRDSAGNTAEQEMEESATP